MEAQGLSNIFKAYAENAIGESIFEIGFNSNSGYTYIFLDNAVTICSMLGRDVEYMVINNEDGEDIFFDTYDKAINYLNNLN
jgi:hypothetical protein